MNSTTMKSNEQNTQHTPGPWVAEGGTFGLTGRVVSPKFIARAASNMPEAEAHANVHLIAAAPELLAALKFALGCAKRDGWTAHPNGAIERMEAAIAKATGKA